MARILTFPQSNRDGQAEADRKHIALDDIELIDSAKNIAKILFHKEDLSDVFKEILGKSKQRKQLSMYLDKKLHRLMVYPSRETDYKICTLIKDESKEIVTSFPFFAGLEFILFIRDFKPVDDGLSGIIISEINKFPFLYINHFFYREKMLYRKKVDQLSYVSAFALHIEVQPKRAIVKNCIKTTKIACVYRMCCRLQKKKAIYPEIEGSHLFQYTVTFPVVDIFITIPLYIEGDTDEALNLQNGVIIEGTFCLTGYAFGL